VGNASDAEGLIRDLGSIRPIGRLHRAMETNFQRAIRTCRERATACDYRAAQAMNEDAKAMFGEAAKSWRLLARSFVDLKRWAGDESPPDRIIKVSRPQPISRA